MVFVTHSFAQTSQRLASRSLRTLRHCQYCYKQKPSQETGRLFAFYAYCQTSRNLVYYAWCYHWGGPPYTAALACGLEAALTMT